MTLLIGDAVIPGISVLRRRWWWRQDILRDSYGCRGQDYFRLGSVTVVNTRKNGTLKTLRVVHCQLANVRLGRIVSRK